MENDKIERENMVDKNDFLDEEKAIQSADTWLTQKMFSQVNEAVYQRGTFTVHIIHAVANGKEYEGVGFAKARPEIKIGQYDADRGKSIARGRSVHDLFMEYKKDRK